MYHLESSNADNHLYQSHGDMTWLGGEPGKRAIVEMGLQASSTMEVERQLLKTCLCCLADSFEHLEPSSGSLFSLRETDNGSARHHPTDFQLEQFVSAIVRLARTGCYFSTNPCHFGSLSYGMFAFHGIANAPVLQGDRVILPSAWNGPMFSGQCIHALIVRPVDLRAFKLVGFAWVVA